MVCNVSYEFAKHCRVLTKRSAARDLLTAVASVLFKHNGVPMSSTVACDLLSTEACDFVKQCNMPIAKPALFDL